MRDQDPHFPLAGYTDAQLYVLLATAKKMALRGRAILGPMSAHAIHVELSRRRQSGRRPAPPPTAS